MVQQRAKNAYIINESSPTGKAKKKMKRPLKVSPRLKMLKSLKSLLVAFQFNSMNCNCISILSPITDELEHISFGF